MSSNANTSGKFRAKVLVAWQSSALIGPVPDRMFDRTTSH